MVYLREEQDLNLRNPSKQDHYLAQIAFEIFHSVKRKSNKKRPFKEFILDFEKGKEKSRGGKKFYTSREAELIVSQKQAKWFAATGYKPDKV